MKIPTTRFTPVSILPIPSLHLFIQASILHFCSSRSLHKRRHDRALSVRLHNMLALSITKDAFGTHHGLDVGMGNGIKLLVLELVIGTDVDVSASVFGGIAISRRGEDCAG